MPDDPRLYDIVRLLHEYVSSPSLWRILQPDINSQAGAEILHHAEGPESAQLIAPHGLIAAALANR